MLFCLGKWLNIFQDPTWCLKTSGDNWVYSSPKDGSTTWYMSQVLYVITLTGFHTSCCWLSFLWNPKQKQKKRCSETCSNLILPKLWKFTFLSHYPHHNFRNAIWCTLLTLCIILFFLFFCFDAKIICQ